MVRALRRANITPRMLYQTTAPSLGDQYSGALGEGTTEGIFYAVSHSKEAETPGNEEFVAKYREMFGGQEVPEDAADAYAAAEVLEAAVKEVGTIERERQLELADWLRENEVDTILGPLSWDDDGRPEGEFLVGQWQSGVPEIVLPGGGRHHGRDHSRVAAGRRRVAERGRAIPARGRSPAPRRPAPGTPPWSARARSMARFFTRLQRLSEADHPAAP